MSEIQQQHQTLTGENSSTSMSTYTGESISSSHPFLTMGYEECAIKVRELVNNALQVKEANSPIYWVVFDIDGTLLTDEKYRHLYKQPSDVFKFMHKGNFSGIKPIVDLYNWCVSKGIKVALITGRKSSMEKITRENLSKVGIRKCNFLCMRPASEKKTYTQSSSNTTMPFKIRCRKQIYTHGGIILANIGDQDTDLEGGYAQYAIKLPSSY